MATWSRETESGERSPGRSGGAATTSGDMGVWPPLPPRGASLGGHLPLRWAILLVFVVAIFSPAPALAAGDCTWKDSSGREWRVHCLSPGYRYELRPRRGLVTGGVVVLTVTWLTSVTLTTFIAANATNPGYALAWGAPVIGPLVLALQNLANLNSGFGVVFLLAGLLDFAVQSAGLTMILVGATTKRPKAVPDIFHARIAPFAVSQGAGVMISGSY